jgi:hypothetical protein
LALVELADIILAESHNQVEPAARVDLIQQVQLVEVVVVDIKVHLLLAAVDQVGEQAVGVIPTQWAEAFTQGHRM